MRLPWVIMAVLLGLVACADEGAVGDGGSAGTVNSASGDRVAAQIVITLHVQGGGEGELAYARSQVAGFGTCADAKVDFETWKIYALMMPGVGKQYAVEERNMLEAYVRPPLELQMSSWSYNEGDWFSLIGK